MGGKRGSGKTHIQYGHVTRPTEIALVCPGCGGVSLARQPCHALGKVTIGDCWPEWAEPWSVACQTCVHRAVGLSWESMRASAPLYFATEVAGVEFWAWNREHLVMIADVLDGGDPGAHRFGYFATYLHREWLRRSRRASFAKAARKLLDSGDEARTA